MKRYKIRVLNGKNQVISSDTMKVMTERFDIGKNLLILRVKNLKPEITGELHRILRKTKPTGRLKQYLIIDSEAEVCEFAEDKDEN